MQELLDAEVPSTSRSSEETGIGWNDCGGEHAIATVEIGVHVVAPCRNAYIQAVPKTTDKGLCT